MGRRLGPYAPLSATYASDDAMIEAGEAAELLYCRGLAFCATSNSDGFISEAQLVRLVGVGMKDAKKRADKLVAVGLWDRVDGGYVIRSWLKWNASAEELGKQRARDRDRKARGNPPPIPDGIQTETDRKPGGNHAESNGTPEGFHPRAPAHEAPARPNHSTELNITPLVPPAESATPTAQLLIAEHIDACRHRPPKSVIGQLGKQVAAMLAEGIDPDHVRGGLAAFRTKDLSPSLLPSLVNGVMNRPATRNGKLRVGNGVYDDNFDPAMQ